MSDLQEKLKKIKQSKKTETKLTSSKKRDLTSVCHLLDGATAFSSKGRSPTISGEQSSSSPQRVIDLDDPPAQPPPKCLKT